MTATSHAALRVLLLTPDFPPGVGGIQRLLERLVANRHEVEYEVIAPPAEGAAAWDAAQPYRVIRGPSAPSRQIGLAALNALAVAHARRTRPHLVLVGHVVAAPGAIAIKRALGIPFAVYFHALEVRQRAGLAGRAGRESAVVIAVSRYTAGLAREAGVPPERIRIIPPGVDLVPGPRAGLDGETPRVLTVARLQDRYKGFDMMLRALPLIRARVPAAEWVVVGEGRLGPEIARQAAAMGLGDAVRLTGALPDEERDAWYERSQVFAMPSRLPPGSAGEGFGIVYLEAATRGVPSVAGNVGGALDAVEDGRSGLLVDPTSHLELAEAIAGLLGDPARAHELGQSAARWAERFAWPRVAREVEAVLREAAVRR